MIFTNSGKWYQCPDGSLWRDRIRKRIPRLRQTCAECGYLVTNHATHEVVRPDRREAGDFEPSTHCYRRIWGGRPNEVRREANKPRLCGSFFPFSDGTATEHRDSHRARSTRRWMIGGSLIAPYGAATSAILAGELTRGGGFRDWVGYGLLIGLGVILLAILVVNRFFAKE